MVRGCEGLTALSRDRYCPDLYNSLLAWSGLWLAWIDGGYWWDTYPHGRARPWAARFRPLRLGCLDGE